MGSGVVVIPDAFLDGAVQTALNQDQGADSRFLAPSSVSRNQSSAGQILGILLPHKP